MGSGKDKTQRVQITPQTRTQPRTFATGTEVIFVERTKWGSKLRKALLEDYDNDETFLGSLREDPSSLVDIDKYRGDRCVVEKMERLSLNTYLYSIKFAPGQTFIVSYSELRLPDPDPPQAPPLRAGGDLSPVTF